MRPLLLAVALGAAVLAGVTLAEGAAAMAMPFVAMALFALGHGLTGGE